jgi:hypothetical protein
MSDNLEKQSSDQRFASGYGQNIATCQQVWRRQDAGGQTEASYQSNAIQADSEMTETETPDQRRAQGGRRGSSASRRGRAGKASGARP